MHAEDPGDIHTLIFGYSVGKKTGRFLSLEMKLFVCYSETSMIGFE